MKTKIANSLIVGLVVVGTLFLGNLVEVGQGSAVMPTLFLCFFALIIALQVVPAMLLLRLLFKEIFRRTSKPKEAAKGSGNGS